MDISDIIKDVYAKRIVEQLEAESLILNKYVRDSKICQALLDCTLGRTHRPELMHELTEEDYDPTVTFKIV